MSGNATNRPLESCRWCESPLFVPHVGESGCSRLQSPEDSAIICNRETPVKLAVPPGRGGLDDVADNLSACRTPWNIFEPVILLRVWREVHRRQGGGILLLVMLGPGRTDAGLHLLEGLESR
jgi:hypothetical protein